MQFSASRFFSVLVFHFSVSDCSGDLLSAGIVSSIQRKSLRPGQVRKRIFKRSPVGKRMSTGLLLYGAPEKTKRENQSSQFFRQAKEHVLPKTVLHRTASCWKNSLVGVFFGQERVIRCASFRRPQELQQVRPLSIRRGGIR